MKKAFILIFALVAVFALTSCSSTRYLGPLAGTTVTIDKEMKDVRAYPEVGISGTMGGDREDAYVTSLRVGFAIPTDYSGKVMDVITRMRMTAGMDFLGQIPLDDRIMLLAGAGIMENTGAGVKGEPFHIWFGTHLSFGVKGWIDDETAWFVKASGGVALHDHWIYSGDDSVITMGTGVLEGYPMLDAGVLFRY